MGCAILHPICFLNLVKKRCDNAPSSRAGQTPLLQRWLFGLNLLSMGMTVLRRLILTVLTALVALAVGSSLISSWQQPQVTSRLQLYQADLFLQATEWQGEGVDSATVEQLRQALLGDEPLQTTLDQYQSVRQDATNNIDKAETAIAQAPLDNSGNGSSLARPNRLQIAIQQQVILQQQLDLRIGLLQAELGETDAALKTWRILQQSGSGTDAIAQTATTLSGLWSQPASLPNGAEGLIETNLDGWFRNQALAQLYGLQNRTSALRRLQAAEQDAAESALYKVIVVGVLPTVGCLLGAATLITLITQRLLRGKDAWIAQNENKGWETPWTGEIIWQVLILGFFFTGQLLLPFLLGQLGLNIAALGSRGRALYSMGYYVLMAVIGVSVIYASIRPYLPLPEGWFQFRWRSNWLLWGIGGYFCALPLMIGISLLNQQFWQGQGGSNPLLQTVLEESDSVALIAFLLTASVAAPIFEEILFRGFLLPSLTRYMPVWGAIALSSFVFAAAHLSLSEVLPLMTLGAMLGFVYTRSRNLLAPIMLHSAWNSVTMIGLFLLGSGSS